MDDAKIHPSHPTRIEVLRLDGDGGGDCEPQPPPIGQQRDRSDVLDWIGNGAGQPHPQHGMAFGDRQPHPSLPEHERAVVPADGDEPALATWEPGRLPSAAAFGGLEPGIRIATQDRAGPDRRQRSGGSSCGAFAAQRLIADNRRQSLLDPLPVSVQQPRPDVTGRAQQSIAADGLVSSDLQTNAGGAMHQPGIEGT
jgi:hypothetical protein